MISTLDVIAGGRAELGIGAGWKEDEWRAYGYGFPDAPERLAILADHLEVISRMLAPGHATFVGRHARVEDAVHEPNSAGGRIPVLIGGNGPKVTWRLAARFADELNLDALMPDEVDAGVAGHRFALRGDRTGPVHPSRVGPRLGPAGCTGGRASPGAAPRVP